MPAACCIVSQSDWLPIIMPTARPVSLIELLPCSGRDDRYYMGGIRLDKRERRGSLYRGSRIHPTKRQMAPEGRHLLRSAEGGTIQLADGGATGPVLTIHCPGARAKPARAQKEGSPPNS